MDAISELGIPMTVRININNDSLAEFCQRHGIAKLSVFGSALREDFDAASSDVDVLVQFQPGADRGLTYFSLARMQCELEDLLGRKVDLSTVNTLDRYLKDTILNSAEVVYDAA